MAVATSTAPAVPAPARDGDVRDAGSVRRERVYARRYDALGSVRIAGDLDAPTVALEGMVTVAGKLESEHLRSDGRLEVAGDLAARAEAHLKGSTTVGGRFDSGDLTSTGRLQVAGAISVNGDARIRGRFEAPGPFAARSAGLEGTVQLPGPVESPFIVLKLRGPSRIGRIHGQHVRILRPFPTMRADATLLVDRIEASEVHLAHVDCEYLRADRIILGPEARITEIDGPVRRVHRTASIGPRAIADRPYGLTR